MADIYFAKVPIRNAYLRVRNRMSRASGFSSLMQRYGINLVLDVGANKGQYARELIRTGYRGRIVSFEPLPSAFEKLKLNRWSFGDWQVEPIALGAENTTATLNVAGNSQSSSLQPMLDAHVNAAPSAAYVDTCEVEVRRLDGLYDQYWKAGDRCYLKLDVQGHEHQVIAGASGCLDRVVAIQMELSMRPLYQGAETWQQAIESMQQLGYQLMSLSPGFGDQATGEMLQADGFFVRREEVEKLKKQSQRLAA
ncbi:FkbM family methyltransferase [Novipirellula artificiosorum]|uniref:2-O-methyltransferase NoeI n=1 Tax=Novipirellula artificiosorum TaxID=2528016 RepID=A0A5C6DID6_9BACT|nr:FkbM family methyltransferase [Novipirellula artificiosorum]TWU35965.1 2-O-methyltransferase NoeI [Novipirellula artificiosorum]